MGTQPGCVEVASDTWIDNEVSQRVHEALGYEVVEPAAFIIARRCDVHRIGSQEAVSLAITTVVHELLSLGRSRFAAIRIASRVRSPRMIGQ